ncbi:MAG: branched-chain amino acid ABC transporter permease [Duganella sp.]
MDAGIFMILMQDGLTSGAVYALVALSLVLIFSVTRVIFIPQGEFVAFGALTLAALQNKAFPASAWLLLAAGVIAFAMDTWSLMRSGAWRGADVGRNFGALALRYLVGPAAVFALCRYTAGMELSMLLQVGLTLLVVVPLGPLLYRIAYQPLANASVLVLLIVSMAVHQVLVGLGLLMFGVEGVRTTSFVDAQFAVGPMMISGQSLMVVAVSLLLIAALYLYFGHALSGKALRATAVNRLGARLVGIGTNQAGKLAFTLAAGIGTLCGILISPLTAIYYESGFLICLKGFVGAIVGGLASYPLAAAGAAFVGLIESYASFWASSFKEVIVFTLIIPVLLYRSIGAHHASEEE